MPMRDTFRESFDVLENLPYLVRPTKTYRRHATTADHLDRLHVSMKVCVLRTESLLGSRALRRNKISNIGSGSSRAEYVLIA